MPPDPLPPACARCGTELPEGTPAGAICEPCAERSAEENMATVQGEAIDFTAAPPVVVEQKPEVIGDYEILGKLGQGGMGAVYRARQISLDRVVALKTLPSQLEEDENYVARFQREAAVAAGLNHPNLVHVYASGVADGVHFIAMEIVEGENLRQRLKREPVPMLDALRICLEVARGLQFAWQRAQLIHRDIKPSNIYLSTTGDVKVGDLGLAKSLLSQSTAGLTHTGVAIGTPHYISPEQARGDKSVDLRADIYSLGCTLYELLTGATPYRGTDPLTVMNMHINSPPPAIMKVLPQCPMPVGRLVNKMLRKSRHERHQNYDELIAAMEAALQQLEQGPASIGPSAVVAAWKEIGAAEQHGLVARAATPVPVAKSPTVTALPPARRSKTGVWIGILTGVLLFGVAAFFLQNPSPPRAAASSPQSKPIASSPAAESSAPRAAEPWRDRVAERRKIDGFRENLGWKDDGVRVRAVRGGAIYFQDQTPSRDSAVRVRWTYPAVPAGNYVPALWLREERDPAGAILSKYGVRLIPEGVRLELHHTRDVPIEILAIWQYPAGYDPTVEHTCELRAVGDLFTFRMDGRELGSARNSESSAAGISCVGLVREHIISEMQTLELDTNRPVGKPEASTTPGASSGPFPATATKDAPFTNSLGMKFVPVPITGGPTGGQRVLFSVWETRVQDYEAFAKETARVVKKPDFEQEPTHPAVMTLLADAKAFCLWLTEQEQKAGRLLASDQYRLPSDHEWSCAVGIGGLEDAAKMPKEKVSRVQGYPWGSGWPPPVGAGNYCGEEAAGSESIDGGKPLAGYRDAFRFTSPVGSFAANALGLFDLGGNASEWCDSWAEESQTRVLQRGASFRDGADQKVLMSSFRRMPIPAETRDHFGFRVVLAPVAR